MTEEYPNEPDDGHEHDWTDDADLPDTGTADVVTVICTRCGMLSVADAGGAYE